MRERALMKSDANTMSSDEQQLDSTGDDNMTRHLVAWQNSFVCLAVLLAFQSGRVAAQDLRYRVDHVGLTIAEVNAEFRTSDGYDVRLDWRTVGWTRLL